LRRRRIRTRRLDLGSALAAALVLGGCGSGTQRAAPPPPRLPADVASRLASRSDEIVRLLAARDGCGALDAAATLRQEAIAAINTGRVPARFQEPLLAAANDLPIRIHCAPRAAPAPANEEKGGKHDRRHRDKPKHGDHEKSDK
jgi:hypothetical protein